MILLCQKSLSNKKNKWKNVPFNLFQKTKFLKYELSNPIGIAAGFDKHGDAVTGLRRLGFSIVEIGSITPEPQPGNPKPRVFRLPEDNAVINRYGFNSEGHDGVLKKVKNLDKAVLQNGLLGINLGKNKNSNDATQDYVLGINKFYDIADYFVINVSRYYEFNKTLLEMIMETRSYYLIWFLISVPTHLA